MTTPPDPPHVSGFHPRPGADLYSAADPAVPPGQPTSRLAIACLACGLSGILIIAALFLLPRSVGQLGGGLFMLTPGIPGLAGVVLGILALHRIRRSHHREAGRRLAITGLVISAVPTLGWAIFWLLILAVIQSFSHTHWSY